MSLPSSFYNFGCLNIIFFGILGESVKCKVGKKCHLGAFKGRNDKGYMFSIKYSLNHLWFDSFFLFDFNIAKMHIFCIFLKDYCCVRPKMTFPVLISDYECHCGVSPVLRPGRKRGFLGYRGYRGFYFSNFYKSVFSIFTYGEYRKLEFKKSKTFEHPCFRYSPIVNIENTDVGKSRIQGQVENADFSDIADFISPTFINPCFRYSPMVNIENLNLKNPRLSNIRVFDIHL